MLGQHREEGVGQGTTTLPAWDSGMVVYTGNNRVYKLQHLMLLPLSAYTYIPFDVNMRKSQTEVEVDEISWRNNNAYWKVLCSTLLNQSNRFYYHCKSEQLKLSARETLVGVHGSHSIVHYTPPPALLYAGKAAHGCRKKSGHISLLLSDWELPVNTAGLGPKQLKSTTFC